MRHFIVITSCFLLMSGLVKTEQMMGMKTYEAVIAGSVHVTVSAKTFYEARDQIIGLYCHGSDCILEGPWKQ